MSDKKLTIKLDKEEWTLDYRKGQPFLHWKRDGVLVVDRPTYGAEERLMKCFCHVVPLVSEHCPISIDFK